MNSNERFVVTGGTGFVGKALIRALRSRGAEVISLARREDADLKALGVSQVKLDLAQPFPDLAQVCSNANAVFHVAAKVDMWGRYQDFYSANVIGTQNIIALCHRYKIPKLVFTSSPSVIADGTDLCSIDESYPYPSRYLAYYPQTKALAEKIVLEVNGAKLATLALRPHLIWGPGDNNFVPTILQRAKAERLVQVGSGKNLVDTTYIDDCVAAHLCALAALESNPNARGRAYFISQGEPVPLWGWINQVLELHGLPPVTRRIPKFAAYAIGTVCEALARIPYVMPDPLLTRFLVSEMATSHYFGISAAREELRFTPQWSIAAALEHTFGREGVTKARAA